MALTQDEMGFEYDDGTVSDQYLGTDSGIDSDQYLGTDSGIDSDQFLGTTEPDPFAEYYSGGEFEFGDAPDEEGSTTVVNPTTGNTVYTYDDGSTLTVDRNGNPVSNTEDPDSRGNSVAFNRALAWTTRNLGSTAARVLQNVAKSPGATFATAFAAAKAFGGSDQTGGYNKPVPKLDMIRQQIDYNDPNRRAGSSGRQYTTNPLYVKEGDTANMTAAQAASDAQKAGILAAYKPVAAPAVNKYAGTMPMKWNTPAVADSKTPAENQAKLTAVPTEEQLMDPNYKIGMATGGIAALAKGGQGRYLQGATDGMADKIPSNIDGNQAAALSHGEFVIPADVVSHLGNGNSDAGAKKLYQMMDRIRQARTGTKEQGKKINPDKFMPGGLAAAYADGGSVQKFETGGVPLDTSKTSTLSPWVGDTVTDMLGKTTALTSTPTAVYGGPLTAGASDLQQQGFAGLSDIAKTGFNPTTFTSGTFDTAAANKYMNPYVMAALNPQIEEARRQSQITQLGNAAKMTQAGAFGGSRSALMDAETQRGLGANLSNIVGTGLSSAYDKAMAQFNAEQGRNLETQKATEDSRRYSADYGLKSISDLLNAGKTQRDIEAEGIAADKRQFEEQQADPYTRLEFQRKMLEGLPIGASTSSVNQDALSQIQTDVAGLASLYDKLSKLGIKTT